MFFHCRDLKFVENGVVYPPDIECIDSFFKEMYKWLGKKCKYCPQIWLSNRIFHTGWTKYYSNDNDYMKMLHIVDSEVLFQFEDDYILQQPNILPVNMTYWEMLMVFGAINLPKITNDRLLEIINDNVSFLEEDEEVAKGKDIFRKSYLRLKREMDKKGIRKAMDDTLFTFKDQVVLPQLDLSKCTKVFYNSENDKIRLLMKFPEEKVFYKRRWYKY